MKLRILWKILDLVAVVISGWYMIIFIPFVLMMLLSIMLLVPVETKISNLLGSLTILLAISAGACGVISLGITALMSIREICSDKFLRNSTIVGLISGIAAAIYYISSIPVASDYFLIWTLYYMIVSATMHLIEFLRWKEVMLTVVDLKQ